MPLLAHTSKVYTLTVCNTINILHQVLHIYSELACITHTLPGIHSTVLIL